MSLPSVEEALARMLGRITPLEVEDAPLTQADGRRLVRAVTAMRDQPPFDASAMDGWAVRSEDVFDGGRLAVIGESVAGRRFDRPVGPGETVRIFTGAALPPGSDRVVVQEDVVVDGDVAIFSPTRKPANNVRPRGCDYQAGEVLLAEGVRMNPWRLALAASAGAATVRCGRRPATAILATGDELAAPGQAVGPDQIYNATSPALTAFIRRMGGEAVEIATAGDDRAAISAAVSGAGFDLLVTIGGASVGDHDLVRPALRDLGAALYVEGVAMRPGKPVWFAVLPDGRPVLGLPGNPASALVGAELFLGPVLAALQGEGPAETFAPAVLDGPLPTNGPREHYVRARAVADASGRLRATPFANQDSSMVSVMAAANVLIRRAAHAPGLDEGAHVDVLRPCGS
jgi:molybdopterin molybdotransferase